MPKADFDQFVKRQQVSPSEVVPIDWNRRRDEWLDCLSDLYEKIEGFLETYISSDQVRREYLNIWLNEENIGSYEATQLTLKFGRQTVIFKPIGTLLIGTKGRVDVTGSAGSARLVLVDKSATSARSLIHVTTKTLNTQAPNTAPQPLRSAEWVWKIAAAPPDMRFNELTQDTFFDMVLAIANA